MEEQNKRMSVKRYSRYKPSMITPARLSKHATDHGSDALTLMHEDQDPVMRKLNSAIKANSKARTLSGD